MKVDVVEGRSRLYAIRQDSSGYWWQCNTDHGAEWTKHVEQAWTRRKALKEVAEIVRRGWNSVDELTLVSLQPQRATDA